MNQRTFLSLFFALLLFGGLVTYGIYRGRLALSITSIPAPTPSTAPETTRFTHPTLGYSIDIPQALEVADSGGTDIQILPKTREHGPGPANFLYVSVVTPSKKNAEGEVYNYSPADYVKLSALDIGESVSLAARGTAQDEWFTYARVDDAQIEGQAVKRFENTKPWEFPSGTTETRYAYEKGEYIYILGSYTGGVEGGASIDPRVAHQTLLTFQTATPIGSDWKTFTSEAHGFTLSYPPDVKHDTTQEGERFLKLGPSQSEGTELYDGISVLIRSGTYKEASFSAFVDRKYLETKNETVQPVVGKIQGITIAGIMGKAFSVSSLGERMMVYLPKKSGEYLEIIDGTVEPRDRTQTFKQIVDTMLDTLRIDYN